MLTRTEIYETLKAYADNGMNAVRAAKETFTAISTFRWRLDMIQKRTGKNPQSFWELLELLAEYEDAEVVRDGILSVLSRLRG